MNRKATSLWRACFGLGVLLAVGNASHAAPLRLPLPEGATHGFPELRDAQGRHLADAEFAQVPEGDRLHVTLSYDFGDGHRVVEDTVVRQSPTLRQETWSWRETRQGEIVRRFAVDFGTGEASAEKVEAGERKRWRKSLQLDRDRAFAGFAFTLALEGLRAELRQGGEAELTAVAFTPEPHRIGVVLSYRGVEPLAMGTRTIDGERYVIHAKIPTVVKWFMHVADTQIWLIHRDPTGFLRWEGSMVEPSDDLVRVDLLPGGP